MNNRVKLPTHVTVFSEVAMFKMVNKLKLNHLNRVWAKTNAIHLIQRIKTKKND